MSHRDLRHVNRPVLSGAAKLTVAYLLRAAEGSLAPLHHIDDLEWTYICDLVTLGNTVEELRYASLYFARHQGKHTCLARLWAKDFRPV